MAATPLIAEGEGGRRGSVEAQQTSRAQPGAPRRPCARGSTRRSAHSTSQACCRLQDSNSHQLRAGLQPSGWTPPLPESRKGAVGHRKDRGSPPHGLSALGAPLEARPLALRGSAPGGPVPHPARLGGTPHKPLESEVNTTQPKRSPGSCSSILAIGHQLPGSLGFWHLPTPFH